MIDLKGLMNFFMTNSAELWIIRPFSLKIEWLTKKMKRKYTYMYFGFRT